ncbi:PREDICTED: serine-rich adhesin for platelets-like [Rhagoletis zephyria]|uniref:serine-rich adhesin for platelets-like n=1 Tax=Rhagoletis zephyria TaxID=28612 RepID=UPI0008113B2C|nr:PREDICTED: serine-rich adhesin for platelets-like [Rhagoletis zephyria]
MTNSSSNCRLSVASSIKFIARRHGFDTVKLRLEQSQIQQQKTRNSTIKAFKVPIGAMSATVTATTFSHTQATTIAPGTDKARAKESTAWTSEWTSLWPSILSANVGLFTTTTTTAVGAAQQTTAIAAPTPMDLQSKQMAKLKLDSSKCRQRHHHHDKHNKNKTTNINIPVAQRTLSRNQKQTQQAHQTQMQWQRHCQVRQQQQLSRYYPIHMPQQQQHNWQHYLWQRQRCSSPDYVSLSARLRSMLKQQQHLHQQQWLRFCLLLVICLSLPSATNTKPQTSATSTITTTTRTAPAAATFTVAVTTKTLADAITTTATTTTTTTAATTRPTRATDLTMMPPAIGSDDNIVTSNSSKFSLTANFAIRNVIIPSTATSVNSTTASNATAAVKTALRTLERTVSTTLPTAMQTFTSVALLSSSETTRPTAIIITTTTSNFEESELHAKAMAPISSSSSVKNTQSASYVHLVNELLPEVMAAPAIATTTLQSPIAAARNHYSNNKIFRNAPSGRTDSYSKSHWHNKMSNNYNNNKNDGSEKFISGGRTRHRAIRSLSSAGGGGVSGSGGSGSSFGGSSLGADGSGSGTVGFHSSADGNGSNHNSIECPRFDENSACPCYKFEDGLFLECPGTTAMSLRSTLERISSPIHSLSIYDFDRSVTSLSQDVFQPGVNIRHLQFSHSHLETLKDNSLRHVRASLESLSIVNGKLTQIHIYKSK